MKEQLISTKPSPLGWVFSSPSDQRLRAGWRILITLLAFLVLVAGVMIVQGLSSKLAPGSFGARLIAGFPPLIALLQSLVATIVVFLARRWLDRRSTASLGLTLNRRAAVDVMFGMLMMGLTYTSIYLLLLKAGWLQPQPVDWSAVALGSIASGLLLGLLTKIFGAWGEELIFRGYFLQNVKDGLSMFWAVVIPSFMFGIVHLTNPNATLAGAANITLAGLLLGYAYVRTRQLWLPIGLHIGNNFFQGTVFGFPVSGLTGSFHLLQSHTAGPEIITGGAFGPEAGLVNLPFLLLTAVAVYYFTRRRVEI